MTEREKIIEIVLDTEITGIKIRNITGGISAANAIADALIAAGIGDVKDVEAEANRYEMLYKLQNRDMALAERRAHDVEHRAEVAERALLFLCDKKMSDISVMVFPSTKTQVQNKQELYYYCIEQAEKELAEERKK